MVKKIPVDVKAVVDEALDVDAARQIPITASVYLDATAPDDLIAHVRSSFASAAAHARISIVYIGSQGVAPNPDDDVAVIVAGIDEGVGKCAADLRDAGIPTMIATTLPKIVADKAQSSGYPIPDGDIIAPVPEAPNPIQLFASNLLGKAREAVDAAASKQRDQKAEQDVEQSVEVDQEDQVAAEQASEEIASTALNHFGSMMSRGVGILAGRFRQANEEAAAKREEAEAAAANVVVIEDERWPEEPYELTDEAVALLDYRMGEWIIATAESKKLSFAMAFPFVRRPLSMESIYLTSLQNAGVGVLVFIPGADMPVMTLNQAKMLLEIAAAYGQPMTIERFKELAAVVGGAFMCRSVAREVAGLVPVLGWAVKGGVGYAGTYAMGIAAIEYFENGAGVSGVTGTLAKIKDMIAPAAAVAGKAGVVAMSSDQAANVRGAVGKFGKGFFRTAGKVTKAASGFTQGAQAAKGASKKRGASAGAGDAAESATA